MSTSRQYSVTVQVGGMLLGVFDSFAGGEMDSAEAKFRPGGMAPTKSLGGAKSVGNVIVGKLYDLVIDHARVKALMNMCGTAPMVVTKTPLTLDGVAVPDPLVYRGTLKRVTPPEHDSESDDPAMLELEMSSATVA